MSLEWLSGAMVERLGWALVHSLWIGAAAGVLHGGLMAGLRRQAAQARYVAGCAVLGLLMAGVVVAFVMQGTAGKSGDLRSGASQGGVAGGTIQVAAPPMEVARPADGGVGTTGAAAAQGVVDLGTGRWENATARPASRRLYGLVKEAVEPMLPWAVGIWVLGVGVLGVWQFVGWMGIVRLRRGARAVEAELAERVGRLARRMGVRRAVEVMESALVRVPTVMGWMKPVILLPAGLALGLSTGQVEAILVHELAHIRRHDYLVNMVQTLVETVLFYHPATWAISRRIRRERELCCDDAVVALGADGRVYAESLLEVARQSSVRSVGLGMAATGRASELRQRIARLLGQESAGRVRHWPILLVVVLLVAGLTMALASTRGSAGDTPAARPAPAMDRTAAVAELVKIVRAGLPAGLTVESEKGEFTPVYWNREGKGVELRIGPPTTPGAMPKPTGRYWLMEAGYDGAPPGPEVEAGQTNPAVEWGLWRGGMVICQQMPEDKVQVQAVLSKALAATDSVGEPGMPVDFQLFVNAFRQRATGSMRWLERRDEMIRFLGPEMPVRPNASGRMAMAERGDELCLIGGRNASPAMRIWIFQAGARVPPQAVSEDGVPVQSLGTWNGRPVYVVGSAWDSALVEVKAALAATADAGAAPPSAWMRRMRSLDMEERQAAIGEVLRGQKKVTTQEIADLGRFLRSQELVEVRGGAALALEAAGDPAGVDALIAALDDPEWLIRAWSIRALGRIGDARACGPILEALERSGGLPSPEDVRLEVARAFGRLRDVRCIVPLAGLLTHENPRKQAVIDDTNEAVATALGHQGDAAALPALQKLLDNSSERVARAAAGAVGVIVGQDFGEEVEIADGFRAKLPSPGKAKAWLEANPLRLPTSRATTGPAPAAGRTLGPAVTKLLNHDDGPLEWGSRNNFLDLDSGEHHIEFPIALALEGSTGVDMLRPAGVDIYMMRLQGALQLTVLVPLNLKLAPVADAAWDGDIGLIAKALEGQKEAQGFDLPGAPRTLAFQTREGAVGVLRIGAADDAPRTNVAMPGQAVTIRYRMVPAQGAATRSDPAKGGTPIGGPATAPATQRAQRLQIRLVVPAEDKATAAEEFPNPKEAAKTVRVARQILLDDSDLSWAGSRVLTVNAGYPITSAGIEFRLTPAGRAKYAKVTPEQRQQPAALIVDGRLLAVGPQGSANDDSLWLETGLAPGVEAGKDLEAAFWKTYQAVLAVVPAQPIQLTPYTAPATAPAPATGPATAPATQRAQRLQIRLVVPAEDKTTPVDEFPDLQDATKTLRVARTILIDETDVLRAVTVGGSGGGFGGMSLGSYGIRLDLTAKGRAKYDALPPQQRAGQMALILDGKLVAAGFLQNPRDPNILTSDLRKFTGDEAGFWLRFELETAVKTINSISAGAAATRAAAAGTATRGDSPQGGTPNGEAAVTPGELMGVDLGKMEAKLAKEVGGEWDIDLHNGLPSPERIVRGHILQEPGKWLVAYDVFPFGLQTFEDRLGGSYRTANPEQVRVLGSTDFITVLESRDFSQAEPAETPKVVQALGLERVGLLEAKQSDMMPTAGAWYFVAGENLYKEGGAGPAEAGTAEGWKRANEFVYRTGLGKMYKVPAARVMATGDSRAGYEAYFEPLGTGAMLRVEVSKSMRLARRYDVGKPASNNEQHPSGHVPTLRDSRQTAMIPG